MSGIERSPYPVADFEARTERDRDSQHSFEVATEHNRWAEFCLRVDDDSERFELTEEALEQRRQQLEQAQELSYARRRDVRQMAMMVGSTVSKMEEELARRTVLDIGCGQGTFGEAIARNAKAKVTFLDSDPDAMANISRKAGKKVVADARDLPFEDESFERTISTYAAITWAETPRDAVQSFNEAVRVTEVGGSFFFLPAFSNVRGRPVAAARSLMDPVEGDMPLAHGVWALQDHALYRSLGRLTQAGLCEVTWCSLVGQGQGTGIQIESISAIVDKREPIPPEVLAENLAFLEEFAA